MSWPANPTNGQQVTINGVIYQYDSTRTVWDRVGSGVSSVALDGLTVANLTVTDNSHLGDIGNITISGGTAGYSLTTDGAGNLSWSPIGGAIIPGGSNTQVQFNNNSTFDGSANFTFNSSTNTLTVNNIVANGSGLTSLTGANVTGVVANANYAVNANYSNFAGNATNAINSTTAVTAGTVTTNAQPNITSVGTLNNLVVTGNITTGNISAKVIGSLQGPVGNVTPSTGAFTNMTAGNLNATGNVNAGNLNATGTVTSSLLTGTITTNQQPNITSLGTLSALVISGEVTGNLVPSQDNTFDFGSAEKRWRTVYISANTIDLNGVTMTSDGNTITTSGSITGANMEIIGQYITTLAPGTPPLVVYSDTQVANLNASLLSGLTPTQLSVATTIVSRDSNRNFAANTITARLFGQANTASTVLTNAQPNITSVGTLTGLTVSGNINAGNVTTSGNITGSFILGNGSLLSGLPGSNIVGTISSTVLANSSLYVGTTQIALNRGSQSQILTGVDIYGNANYATSAGTVISASQPNITSVGTLTGLVIAGNLTVTGTTQYSNVNTLNIKDPIIEIGGNPNGSPLPSNDGKDRGALLHYYSDSPVDAFMGWKNSNNEFVFASNVSTTQDVVSINSLGNVRANNFIGNLQGSTTDALNAVNVTGSSQPNIRSLGTLTGLNVTSSSLTTSTPVSITQTWNNGSQTFTGIRENIIDTNSGVGSMLLDLQVGGVSQFKITKQGVATGNGFVGNGYGLSSINAANLTGSLPAANYAEYSNYANFVLESNQPNITSLGILDSLKVTQSLTSTSVPVEFTQTWTDPAVNYTLLKGTITDVGSVSDSKLLDFTVDNLSKFNVDKNGNVVANNFFGTLVGTFQGTIAAPGANRNILFNDGGNINGSNDIQFNKATGTLTTKLLTVNSGSITGNSPAQFNQVWNNNQANFTTMAFNVTDTFSQSGSKFLEMFLNGTSRFIVSKSGNVTGNVFFGSGSGLTNIQATNITGTVANANYANTADSALVADTANYIVQNNQPNITSVGVLTNLSANSGTITSNTPYTFIQNWNNGSEQFTTMRVSVTDTSSASDSALASFQVNGSTRAEISKAGKLTAVSFAGDAGNLSNLPGGNVVGVVANANYATYAGTATFAATSTLSNTVNDAAQPNITSTGTLTLLNVNSGTQLVNLPVTFRQNWQNVLNRYTLLEANVTDVASANNSMLLDLKVNGFSRANVDKNGNISGRYIFGDGGFLSNLSATANFANYAGNVTVSNQPNITSLGTLTGLNVTSTVTTTTAPVTITQTWNNASATLTGISVNVTDTASDSASSLLKMTVGGTDRFTVFKNGNISASGNLNVTNINSTLVAGTLTTAAQPNITSVGTLGQLNVTANVTAGNLAVGGIISGTFQGTIGLSNPTSGGFTNITASGNISSNNTSATGNVTANYFVGDGRYLTNLNPSAINFVANANYANFAGESVTVSSASQPNITSLGTLISLAVTGNITGNNVNVTNTIKANNFSDANLVSANFITGTLTTNAQPNITSIGTLTGLSVGYGALTSSNPVTITQTWNNSSVTFTGIRENITDTNSNSNSLLIDLQVGGTSRFTVNKSGNIVASNIVANIPAANVIGTVANANYSTFAGTVTTASQPNITSIGTLNGLTVGSGTIDFTSASSVNIGSNTSVKLTGGSPNQILTTDGLGNLAWRTGALDSLVSNGTSNLNIPSINGNVIVSVSGNSNILVVTGTGANITGTANITGIANVGSNLNVVGNITSGNANLGNLLTANFVTGTLTTASQPNITSVGTLSDLSISGTGNVTGANLVSANYVSGTLTTAAQPNITSTGTLSSLTVSGALNVNGLSTFFASQDRFSTITGATGVVTHDLNNGAVFYHTSPAANFTPNFTNVPTTNNYSTVAVLFMVQGATPYMPTATTNVQIGGSNVAVKWLGASAPTGTASAIDMVSYSLLRVAGTWTVLGQAGYFN